MSENKPTTEQFLAEFPSQIQELARNLDTLIKSSVPEARALVYTGWRLIGYRAKRQKRDIYFAYVYPTHDYVDLGFEFGILIRDQHHLLLGDGNQVRYARLVEPDEIPKFLSDYIIQAADIAFLSKDQKQKLFLERDTEIDAKGQGPSDV